MKLARVFYLQMWNVIGQGVKPCKSLLFANGRCYRPRSETRKSLVFANVRYYWPRSETLKEFAICKCEILLATE